MQKSIRERWRPVADYEGFYKVSDLGRVKSLPRRTAKGLKGGRILKGTQTQSGHVCVTLSKNGNMRRRMVHQLVAEAFIGPRPDGYETRHANDIGTDNRLVNLSYGTSADNKQDAIRNGRNYFANRTHCPKGHPYDEENTYRTSKGGRDCKACNTAQAKRRKDRQRHGIGKPCTTAGCKGAQMAKGLCATCYIRAKRESAFEPGSRLRVCPHCGEVFERPSTGKGRPKYCSPECAYEVRLIAARDRMRRLAAERRKTAA